MQKSTGGEEVNMGVDSFHREDAKDAKRSSAFSAMNLLLLIVLLAALALRLTDLTLQNIWWDEARNIDVALRPFWQIPGAPELDIQPPLYYWLLHGWFSLAGVERGDAPIMVAYVARYFSVWFGVLGVALLYALTRRLSSAFGRSVGQPAGSWTRLEHDNSSSYLRHAALIAAAIGAASPFWLAESQETRMYTLAFALLLAAALAWVGIGRLGDWEIDRGRPNRSPNLPISQSLFVLLSAAALATHYNAVFILVAWYAGWGMWALTRPDRWRQLGRIVLTGTAMTVLLLPLIPIALRQIPDYANPNLTVPTVTDYLVQNWTGFLGGYAWSASPLGNVWLWIALGLLAVSLQPLALSLRRPHSQFSIFNFQFSILWLFGGLALYYIAVMDRGAFNIRYSGFVTPALYALLGMGAATLGRIWKPLPLLGAAILLVGLLPAAQADLTDTRFFREDTAGAAAWLRASTGPGDVIFVDQKYPFGFYYGRYAIDPSATPVGPELAPARYLFVDINTIDQGLTEWAGDARRVFWVQWFESDTDPRGAVPFLLGKYGTLAGEQTFQGYRLNWWDLTPPTTFALADSFADQSHGFRVPDISGQVWTESISLPSTPVTPGRPVDVVMRWRAVAGDLARPIKVRVALYDDAGNRLAQDDRRLLNDRHLAPSQWGEADRPLNVYAISTPDDLTPGAYDVRLLAYDADTLDPLELLDAAGNPAGQEVSIGSVRIGGTP